MKVNTTHNGSSNGQEAATTAAGVTPTAAAMPASTEPYVDGTDAATLQAEPTAQMDMAKCQTAVQILVQGATRAERALRSAN